MHDGLAAEFARSGAPFRLTNHATDWVFLDHPACGKGVRCRYRIRGGHAELRLNKKFPADHSLPGVMLPAFVERIPAGMETVYRFRGLRVSESAKRGAPSEADVREIAAALGRLTEWWSSSVVPGR